MAKHDGAGLALSGGGYRASLFHLGVVRRLHELGILQKITHLSTVSGGSILAGYLADKMLGKGLTTLSFDDKQWDTQISAPFRKLTAVDIRTRLVLRYFGWNLLSPKDRAKALADYFWWKFSSRRLGELPKAGKGIQFVFLATDVQHGIAWEFRSRKMGSWKAGKEFSSEEVSIARAVAASACFPPVFGPIRLPLPNKRFAYLSDGGVYDNSGMEPLTKKLSVVMLSDAGAPLPAVVPKAPWSRLLRYSSIAMDQVRAQRQRNFIATMVREKKKPNGKRGTLWRIGSHEKNFLRDGNQAFADDLDALKQAWYGYSSTTQNTIESIRTDLDSFTDSEARILENHGYHMADMAVRCHLRDIGDFENKPFNPPHPNHTDDDEAQQALRYSHSRMAFVRRWFHRTQRGDQNKSPLKGNQLMSIKFDDLKEHYPVPTSDDDDRARADLYNKLGGEWPKLIDDPKFENTCAIRMSVAFYQSGNPIPKKYREFIDKDGNTIIASVNGFRKFMQGEHGDPWGMSKVPGSDIEDDVPKVQGIIVYHVKWTNATGHFDLWTGSDFVGSGSFDDVAKGYDIALWFVA